MQANERGSYGQDASKKGGALSVVIVLGLGAVVIGLSPGVKHWYKHGRLPAAEDTLQWRR